MNFIELVAWKLLNPTNSRSNPDCPQNAEMYELATKYNYQPEEKAAMIEVLIFTIINTCSNFIWLRHDIDLKLNSHSMIRFKL